MMEQTHRVCCASCCSVFVGYAESTVDLIEALQLDQPDILGWSLGGFIALTIAVEYPDMVNRVVLADTTSGGKLGELPPLLCLLLHLRGPL